MTKRQFYDWQTAGGADDVMRMVDALERIEICWCIINDIAVDHWALEPIVTCAIDIIVATEDIDRSEKILCEAGFSAAKHAWSINFTGKSNVSIQLSTEEFYRDFPSRAVAADVHGILLRVACLRDTLAGKIKAYSDTDRRQSKRLKDLADIVRLAEAHPELRSDIPVEILEQAKLP
jgi:hypothetical protein